MVRRFGSFERACDIYVTDLEAGRQCLGVEEEKLIGRFLLSLKYLQIEFLKWKASKAVGIEHTIRDLYTSPCVLKNQVWVPVSVLGRMWRLDEKLACYIAKLFCEVSLATLSFRKTEHDATEKPGLTLHDLHLEFCKQEAKSGNSNSAWHSTLLSGYLEPPSNPIRLEECALSPSLLAGLTPGPWWSDEIPKDGYIHANLARHLSMCDRGSDLPTLL